MAGRALHLLGIVSALIPSAVSFAQESGASEDTLVVYGEGVGEYRLRVNFLNAIPLSPGEHETLGQQFWVDQWFRVRLDFGVRDRFRLVGETDAFDGLVVGQFTHEVEAASGAREAATAFPGIRPRALFLDWTPEELHLQAGLMPVHWGLGIFDNDGAHEPPFGDYRYGDIMTRVGVSISPFGEEAAWSFAAAGDLVFEDQMADIRDDDLAWRGVLAAVYREDERRLGFYGAYRHQRSELSRIGRPAIDVIDAVTLDVFARWDVQEPSGGTLFAALEAAYTHSEVRIEGLLAPVDPGRDELAIVAQVGRRSGRADVMLELGYASEGGLDRAVIHPDHQVGLILFPEVIAWQSARSATLIEEELLEGEVPAGTPLVPTEGGVANAIYLQPVVTWRIASFLRARFGAVWARAVTDVVDPYRAAARAERRNYRGGDPENRDLGLELDAQIHAETELSRGIVLSGGLEGAWFLPGHAFDDASGDTMDPLGLFRVRMGLTF